MDKNIQELFSFIEKSKTSYHATKEIGEILEQSGFEKLLENKTWDLKPEGCYYIVRDQTSIIAFKIGSKSNSYRIVASHNDSPGFKIKPNGFIESKNYYQLNTEVYGGPIYLSWFDRVLQIGGRILVKTPNGIKSEIVSSEKAKVLIPELAIHLNKEVNKGMNLNPQVDLLPLVAQKNEELTWKNWLAKSFGKEENEIVAHDLFLYNPEIPKTWNNDQYFSAPRIDNLECAYSTLKGFLESSNEEEINVYACFNNEEIGSLTKQGAASTFLIDTLTRIRLALGKSDEEEYCMLANSIIVSADNAHAQHPNHSEKTDPVNYTKMNDGIVIKHSARQSYTSDAMASSLFQFICDKAKVPYQNYTNRSDERGGGTLGAISSSHVSIASVDIGLAQLAMHSAFETAGTKDVTYMVQAIKAFFEIKFEKTEDGWSIL